MDSTIFKSVFKIALLLNRITLPGTSSFKQKIAAAKLVKQLGFPLTINVVLPRQNLDRIKEIIELCRTLKADRVELANTQYYGWALQNRSALLPTPEQLERAKQAVAIAQKESTFQWCGVRTARLLRTVSQALYGRMGTTYDGNCS